MRMLELLDGMISNCKECKLYNGGRVKPYWTPMSRFVAIGEAPGKQEVDDNEPFVGKAGEILGEVMSEIGFRKEEFLIINSVNCRPTDGNKNGKPTEQQTIKCKKWLRKYIKVLNPEKMISFGNIAMGTMIGKWSGILRINGTSTSATDLNRRILMSIHPAYCIYNREDGIKKLKESIGRFKKL